MRPANRFVRILRRLIATATCYASGNAGGIFGPSLFMGASAVEMNSALRSMEFRLGISPNRRSSAKWASSPYV
jgi:H+/Cl- antiporter ClcA